MYENEPLRRAHSVCEAERFDIAKSRRTRFTFICFKSQLIPDTCRGSQCRENDTNEQVDIQTMGHLFPVGMQSMNGDRGQDTSKAYSRCLFNHVHNHALIQFYLGRQGATDFHPKSQKRIGLTSLYFKLGGLVDRGAPRGRAGYLATPGGDSMVFGSATLGVSSVWCVANAPVAWVA